MPTDINAKIKSLLRSDYSKDSDNFYNHLIDVNLELITIDPQKKMRATKKLEKIISTILEILVKETNSNKREKIITFLDNLLIEYYSDNLIKQIFSALVEAINWDDNITVKEKATNVIFNYIFINMNENEKKRILSNKIIFDNHEKLIEIYYNSEEPAIKSRITAVLSYLTINLFSDLFSKVNLKERLEIFHLLINVIIDSFNLTILDHPRRIIIDNFEPIINSINKNLEPDPIRFDLIKSTISRVLDSYEFLPIVYHEIILSILFNLVLNLGESLSEEILIHMIILLESPTSESLQKLVSDNLTKFAQSFGYSYSNKLISQYSLVVKRYKHSKTRIEKNQLLTSIAKNCFWCNYPVDQNASNCPNCGKEILKCIVCKLPVDNKDEVGLCSLCEVKGHLIHLQEWVKINGKCPNCLQQIPLEGIIQLVKENNII
ncbi:MAG: hypothetical protein FK730_01885 [Asgard group archaeon]|nr:hypothetical protein [Asgard group archaeon]